MPLNRNFYSPALDSYAQENKRPYWSSGDPYDYKNTGYLKYGAVAGGLFGSGFLPVGKKRLWDYYVGGMRHFEEYFFARIPRTLQLSNFFSQFESAARGSRTFTPEILEGFSAGQLDYLEKLTGTKQHILQRRGLTFKNKALFFADTGERALKRAGIYRNINLSPRLSNAYARSLGMKITDPTKLFEESLPFLDAKGALRREQFQIIGGTSRAQHVKRQLFGIGTEMVERANRLAKTPFEMPILGPLLSKLPIRLHVEPGTGLQTLGRMVGRLGVLGGAGILGYKYLDYLTRNTDLLNKTVFDQGLTAGAAGLYAQGHIAYSKLSQATGLSAFSERQEEVAPGSTSLQKLAAFPLMGALGATGLHYLKRASLMARVQSRGRNVALASNIVARYMRLHDKEGIVGRIGRKLLESRSGIIRSIGKSPISVMATLGAIAGTIPILPFIPGALASKQSPKELEDIYYGGKEVAVRRSRFWEMGMTPWEGTSINYYRPHLVWEAMHRSKEKGLWGPLEQQYGRELSPVEKFWKKNFTYDLERATYYDRPYTMTGAAFGDVPIIGPALSATIGNLIKPQKIMHADEFLDSRGRYLESGLGFGDIRSPGEQDPESPISPRGIKGTIGEQAYRMSELSGLPGFFLTSIKEKITGSQDIFDRERMLQSADRAYGGERDYWDLELGGGLGSTEFLRRLIPHRRKQIEEYNPVRNTMPDWLPGSGERGPDLLHGDPYLIPFGESRLPGKGYCVTPDVNVLTNSGYKPIEDILPLSDMVITRDGWQLVKEKLSREYDGIIIDISAIGGFKQQVSLTPEHKVLAVRTDQCKYHRSYGATKKRRPCKPSNFCINMNCNIYTSNKIEWVSAKDLEEGDHVIVPIKENNIDYPDLVIDPQKELSKEVDHITIDSQSNTYTTYRDTKYGLLRHITENFSWISDWFIFGLYIAEGSIGSTLSFALHEDEEVLVEKIKTFYPNAKRYFKKKEKAQNVNIGNKAYKTIFNKYFGRSDKKKIPRDISKKQFIELLSGWFQGDSGNVEGKETPVLTIAFKYKQLLADLIYLLYKFGYDYSICERANRECYEIRLLAISSNILQLVDNKEIKFSTSKTITGFWIDGYRAHKIQKISARHYKGLVYDLSVDNCSEFNTSFIIHNSARFPELKDVAPANYPLIHQYRILADTAPYTDQMDIVGRKVKQKRNSGDWSDYEENIYQTVQAQYRERREKKIFFDYKYSRQKLNPVQEKLAAYNESQSKEGAPSWFERTVGSYWENLAHNAETPFEQLTPISPAAKLLHTRTAREDYERTQIFGSEAKFWNRPMENFIRPFMSSAGRSLGDEDIPTHVQDRRNIEEYFDILKYVKYTRLKTIASQNRDVEAASEFEGKRRETLFGLNPFSYNYSHIFRSLPRRDRDYFTAFSETKDLNERAEILKLVPKNEKGLYVAKWKQQDASDFKKAEKLGILSASEIADSKAQLQSLYKDRDSEGFPKTKELWAAYVATRLQNESYPDWYRRVKLAPKRINELGFDIPGPDFVGFRPDVQLDDIKLKLVQKLGESIQDYDLWPSQEKQLQRRENLVTEETLKPMLNPKSSEEDIRREVQSVLTEFDVSDAQIHVAMSPSTKGRIDMDVKSDRRKEIKEYKQRGII